MIILAVIFETFPVLLFHFDMLELPPVLAQ